MDRFLERLTPALLCVILVVVTLAVFGPFLSPHFVSLDDGLLIYSNPAVQELSARSLWHIVTNYDPELYIPLTFFTYQLNHLFIGLHAFWYHLTNLLLHAGSAVLVFWIIQLLIKNRFAAFFCAILFAIHPLQTEAVAWAAARKDVLSSFFFLASVLFYLFYRKDDQKKWYRWSIIAFALGLLSKVSIIFLPLVLLLLDWREHRPMTKKVWIEKIPYAILSVIFGVIGIIGKTQVLESSSLSENLLLGARSTVFYFYKLFWPAHLAVIYPQTTAVTLADPLFLISVIGVLLILVAAFLFRRNRTVAVGLIFYVMMLLPSFTNFLKNGFLFFGSDRYVYLAIIGLALVLGDLLMRFFHRHKNSSWVTLSVPLMIIMIVAMAGLSMAQATTWHDSESLYRSVIVIYPNSSIAHNNLGDILMKAGRVQEAEQEFQKTLQIDPNMMAAHLNMGNVYKLRGEFDKATAEYQKAIAIADRKPSLNLDELGPYYYMGELLDQLGKTQESIAMFEHAVARGSTYAEPHYNLGLQYQKNNRSEDAIAQFKTAIQLEPNYFAAHYHLAGLLAEKGLLDDAIAELKIVQSLAPHYEETDRHLQDMQRLRGAQ